MTELNDHDTVVLAVEGVSKQFPGVLANDNVDLTLRKGEILALLGENGAGKSTLMNIIYGLYRPTSGTLRLKGREVAFRSPREAIHNGIGMVHQHFQLVPIMTVAENVVLGEEGTAAYKGERHPALRWLLRWLPSLVVFLAGVVIGLSLGKLVYTLGGVAIGAALGALVAYPAAARLIWGVAWRVGLALVAVAIAAQVEQMTRVGIADVALRQQVAIFNERRPDEMDGYTVKQARVYHQRIDFNWSKQYRDAGGDIDKVITSAKAQLEDYRDNGIPGWLIDAIDDAPPVTGALAVALLLLAIGAHALSSWRGSDSLPGALHPVDLALMGALIIVYAGAAWTNLDGVSTGVQLVFFAVLVAGLAGVTWRTIRHRAAAGDEILPVSPLDGTLDAFLMTLNDMTEIRNLDAAKNRVRELSRQYGLEVDPDAVIEKLPVGMQQRVEIIKALYRQADILILDEPTAVLTPQEGRELFKIMRELAAQGVSIIFITHKLKEVFEVATHIAVMRGGKMVGYTTPEEATETSLAAMMVGREVILQIDKDVAKPGEVVLQVEGLSALDNRNAQALDGVSFEVCAGEVLGIAGVQGNGQTELVEVLTGLREAAAGSVTLLGMDLQPDEQPEGSLMLRAAAWVIDTVLVALLAYFVGFFVWYFNNGSLSVAGAIGVILVVDALYFFGSWLNFGATLGMALFGLEITTIEHTHRPSALKLVERYLLLFALRLPLFVPLAITFRAARQSGSDRLWCDERAGLRVIKRERIIPRRIKDIGTSHVPEDRQRHGLVKPYTVADNLILNDYYERPFAKEPNAAQLPVTLTGYLVVVGVIIAIFTTAAVYLWDQYLWTALLDAYHVPQELREIGPTLSSNQRAELQYPLVISALLLIVAEMIFGVVAHAVANRVLGVARVQALFRALGGRVEQTLARAAGSDSATSDSQGGLLRNDPAITRHARDLIREYDIRTPGPGVEAGNLSGGNQQKMIVAREFSRRPRLLIAAQPTRGIDVGSIEFIHRQIIDQRDAGAAVLLVSAELDEIMALSDRIAVLYKGHVIDTLPAGTATREQLGLLMAGIKNGGSRANVSETPPGPQPQPSPAGA